EEGPVGSDEGLVVSYPSCGVQRGGFTEGAGESLLGSLPGAHRLGCFSEGKIQRISVFSEESLKGGRLGPATAGRLFTSLIPVPLSHPPVLHLALYHLPYRRDH